MFDVIYFSKQCNHSKLRNLSKFIRNGHKGHETVQKFTNKVGAEMFCTFAGMTSLTPDSELCNFITV